MTTRQMPQIPPQTPPLDEAHEDAVELARALQWAAEHAHEALLTRAELERDWAA